MSSIFWLGIKGPGDFPMGVENGGAELLLQGIRGVHIQLHTQSALQEFLTQTSVALEFLPVCWAEKK